MISRAILTVNIPTLTTIRVGVDLDCKSETYRPGVEIYGQSCSAILKKAQVVIIDLVRTKQFPIRIFG